MTNQYPAITKHTGPYPPPLGAPPVAFDFQQARLEWFERYGCAIVEKNRYFLIALLSSGIALALLGCLFYLLPLKTITPYIIKVEPNGKVTTDNAIAQQYIPGVPELHYFLSQWSIKMLSIDPNLTEKNYLPEAYSQVVGIAVDQFQDWIRQDRPITRIHENPSFSRITNIVSVAQVQDNVMLIRVRTEERSLHTPSKIEHLQITVHYVRHPPKTPEEIQRNPMGLFISSFQITKELS